MAKDYFAELFKMTKKEISQNITNMYIARINKLNPPKANLQPLAVIDGKKQNEVENAHFLIFGNEKLNYQEGDIVIVGCLDYDNSLYRDGKSFNVSTNTMHSIDYSIVIGKLATKDDFKGGDT